jgi:ComEC/Rec2-related protein
MHLRRIINPPNFLLLLLTGVCLFYSWIIFQEVAYRAAQPQQYQGQITIRDRQFQSFGQVRYAANSESGLIHVRSDDFLEIGQTYRVQGELSPYKLQQEGDDFNIGQYYLSNRIQGKLDVEVVEAVQAGCSLGCQMWQTSYEVKRWVEFQYDNYHCKFFIDIAEWITGLPCQNTKAWSVGLIIGGDEFFTNEFADTIRLSGLTHLIAVSGFQVSILTSVLEQWFTRFRMRRLVRVGIIIGSYGLMLLLVGAEPPVLRSMVSVGVSLLVLSLLGRRIESFRLLIYSAIILLFWNPLFIVSASFWLSFTTSLGLILGMSSDVFQRSWLQSFKSVVLSSLLAFGFSLPIILRFQETISFTSIVTNSLIVPIIPFVSLLNILSLVPILGYVPALGANLIQNLINWLIILVTQWSPLVILESFSMLETAFYYIIIAILIFITKALTKAKK